MLESWGGKIRELPWKTKDTKAGKLGKFLKTSTICSNDVGGSHMLA